MYNRYIPQPDGSFRRSRVDEQRHRQSPPPKPQACPPPPTECCPPPEPVPCPPPPPQNQDHRPRQEKRCDRDDSIKGFLQNLFPKDLDTGDLIVILLLLLLAGDCEEDRSTALLTLVLYLFM